MTLFLLPLGLLALLASLQSIRSADKEKNILISMAAQQSARRLSAEIMADQAAMRLMANALVTGKADPRHCARMDAFLRSRSQPDTLFIVYTRSGRILCQSYGKPPQPIAEALRFTQQPATLLPDRGALVTRTFSTNGQVVALVLYDRRYLGRVTDPALAEQNRHMVLSQGGQTLDIGGSLATAPSASVVSLSAPVSEMGLTLTMMVRDPPATLARTLSLFLPLLMWFAGTFLSWAVVSRLLIRPLVELQRVVANYHPGEVLEPLRRMRTPAREIAALGNTFREISEDVAEHEAEMAASLDRQRRLTREVHHRVKNNLQIIASLINLHARSAETPAAGDAYASIQRRVDALSVVHRNHYAELEENRGLSLRALISELSASLRATAPADAAKAIVQVDSDHLHVSQDVAVPVAFLITEIVELAMRAAPGMPVSIAARRANEQDRATVTITSPALRPSQTLLVLTEERYGRVLTGLSRQLRAPLIYDEVDGGYAIDIIIAD